MGTKIEYSINLLASSVDSKKFTEGGVNVWEHHQNKGGLIGVNKLKDHSMDRKLDRNSLESIKKTMQMHEDIFKHQVRELHKLYSVQKMLMEELKKETKQKKLWNPMNDIGIGTSQPHFVHQQHQTTETSYIQSLRHDHLLSSKEKSGSCSGDTIKLQRGIDLEIKSSDQRNNIFGGCEEEGEAAGPSTYTLAFQSCNNNNKKKSNNDGSDEEDMEVDLTLSIGGTNQTKNKNKKKKSFMFPLGCLESPNGKIKELNSSVSFQSDHRVGDCSDPTTPISSSSVTFDQERKGPHWLSQGLKLK